ncbi:MAG: family transcriptional regulator, cyclic receptor protein [Solirubrobacteraceae bacterium]|jgi:CRP-like cAMP-binding protein|nr:family transcriptional regulator, cyclic receptor protein [Solirubrobacteraceae bacterium]
MARSDSLARVPILATLPPRELKDLSAAMREHKYSAGDNLTTEGEGGIAFFVILDGTATISVHGEPKGRLAPGDYFGEIAMIAGDTRAATITAETDMRCLSMTRWEFRPFVTEHPDVAWTLLETLARRLREAGVG